MTNIEALLEQFIYPILPSHIVGILSKISMLIINQLTEIRLRSNQPIILVFDTRDGMIDLHGNLVSDHHDAYYCSADDIQRTLQMISKNSLYAFEQEMRLGYITIPGGHRIGLAGQAILHEGQLVSLKNISSMNIRLAREIIGCASKIIPYIITQEKRILNTLLISPPRCGKTTILRDLIRQISIGNRELNFPGQQVCLVDERSEIAACQNGIPTVDLGQRIDVMDGCPKAKGMMMMIRSLSPSIVATDELGRQEDVDAVQEALTAGVTVITTVHGNSICEVQERPFIGELIKRHCFQRYVLLNNKPNVGTVNKIVAAEKGQILFLAGNGVKECG